MISPGTLWMLPPPSAMAEAAGTAGGPSNHTQLWAFPSSTQIINLATARQLPTAVFSAVPGLNLPAAVEIPAPSATPMAGYPVQVVAASAADGDAPDAGAKELQFLRNSVAANAAAATTTADINEHYQEDGHGEEQEQEQDEDESLSTTTPEAED